MRRVYAILVAAFAISFAAALTACSTDELDQPTLTPNTSDNTNIIYRVTATLGDETRAQLLDGESIQWTERDSVYAYYIDAAGNYEKSVDGNNVTLREKAYAVSIGGENNTSAVFEFKEMPEGGKAWIAFGGNYHADANNSARKVEFNYNTEQYQEEPGKLNTYYLRMVSDPISPIDVPMLAEGETVVDLETSLKLAGSLVRYIIYSPTGKYGDESVKSVEFLSVDKVICGDDSAVAYNFADYWDTAEKGYKYWSRHDGVFNDECTIFWDATSKGMSTMLEKPASLAGVTDPYIAEDNSVYMVMPAVKVGGYHISVTTDKAVYTFSAPDKALQFKDNNLRNIMLNLEHSAAVRVDAEDAIGELRYRGDLNEAVLPIKHWGCTNKFAGYLGAETRLNGEENWTEHNNNGEDTKFYQPTFEARDVETGELVDWVSVYYENNSKNWRIDAQPQPVGGAVRKAEVTATYPSVDGYIISGAYNKISVIVQQEAYDPISTIGFFGGPENKSYNGKSHSAESLGYIVITVNGQYAEDWAGDSHNEDLLYASTQFTCYDYTTGVKGEPVDWITVDYGKDGEGNVNTTHWHANITENTAAEERKALVECVYTAPEGYRFEDGTSRHVLSCVVTQMAYDPNVVVSFWGGLGDYTTDAKEKVASTGWDTFVRGEAIDISYWVAMFDGQNATNWGDSMVQKLYGEAVFEYFDYTSGVKGEPVDWFQAHYDIDAEGSVKDTWWVANVRANETGAERKVLVVCTFPDMEGYRYDAASQTKSIVVTQKATID